MCKTYMLNKKNHHACSLETIFGISYNALVKRILSLTIFDDKNLVLNQGRPIPTLEPVPFLAEHCKYLIEVIL